MKFKKIILTAMISLAPFSSAFAADVLNSGDTAWIIVATAGYGNDTCGSCSVLRWNVTV